jgi:asparagine synthase (glutamine-hydrolysing)
MFSFAIWDKGERKLFCARDRLGIKPFYYLHLGDIFVFGSEIKAILEHPRVSARLNRRVLREYMSFGYLSGDETLFQGIRKLPPGHTLTLHDNQIRIERYWDCREHEEADLSEQEFIDECRQRLENSVESRLMSDVPLGMFLSGGIDSTAITAIAQRLVKKPMHTFSVGYREGEWSELSEAKESAQLLGTVHREVSVGMVPFFRALPKMIWHEDEPITWPSSVSLYFVAKLAAEDVKVVLTGEGSDEIFAGYSRYYRYGWNRRWGRFYNWLPASLRDSVRHSLKNSDLVSRDWKRRIGHTFVGRQPSLESVYLDGFYSAFDAEERDQILLPSDEEEVGACETFLYYYNRAITENDLERVLYADHNSYLVELLMKQDQMSMAASLESRVPFLDHPLVEFAARLPQRMKIRGKNRKYILRKAVEDIIPREVLTRKKKGFPTPISDWLLSPEANFLYDHLVLKDGLLASICDMDVVRKVIEDHRAKRRDATDQIWRLIDLQLWGDIFLLGHTQLVEEEIELPVS